MHAPLLTRLLTTIRKQEMVLPGDRVAVAVSGGGDSVALLLLLLEMRETLGATVLVAHFNHHLRPQEADEDERFVRRLASDFGLACIVAHGKNLAGPARRPGTNVEAEARAQRYAFFHELVSQGRATRVATGHTVDDQAETVLGRLARGSGLRGLAGIHPVLGPVVRPQLDLRRKELREYLTMRGQAWREDATNLDTSRLRARIRHKLLPIWEAEFGPSAVVNLARLAELARNDEALLEEQMGNRFPRPVRPEEAPVTLEVGEILDPQPRIKDRDARQAWASRLVRRAAGQVKRDMLGLTADHVSSVLDLAQRGTSGSKLELPGGIVVERVLNRLIFISKGATARIARADASYAYLADPWQTGEDVVEIAETGKRLRLKLIDWPPPARETYLEGFGVLDAGRLEPPLLVRSRLPGDSYRPRGRGHAEKLKRLLLERRVAGKERILWPVLTSAGRLVWSSGLPVAADFAAGPGTQRALIIHEEPNERGGENSFHETGMSWRASKG